MYNTCLADFINKHRADVSLYPVSEKEAKQAARAMGVRFGPQLTEYLTRYGYAGYKSIEFYGLTAKPAAESDLIHQTKLLHKWHPITKKFTAISYNGDDRYVIVDRDDQTYLFDAQTDALTPTGQSLFDYMVDCFEAEI